MRPTPRPPRLTALAALGAGLLVAASGTLAHAQSPTPAPASPAIPGPSAVPGASEAPDPSFQPPPEVTVTDRGDRPRARLRFAFQAGTTDTMVVEMTQKATSSVDGGTAQVVALPVIAYSFGISIDAVDAAGTATITMTLDRVEVRASAQTDDATVQQVQAALDALVGYRVVSTVDDRGRTLATQAELPVGLDPALAGQMSQVITQANQLGVTLPLERVGEGATWTSTGAIAINGLSVESTQTTKLEKEKDGRLTLRTTTVQAADPGPVTWPGVPDGWSTTLTSLAGKANLRQVVDLTTVRVNGTGNGTIRVVLELTDGTQTHTSDSTADTKVKVTRGG